MELVHVWADSPGGLLLNSTFVLGARTPRARWLNDALTADDPSSFFPPDRLAAWTLHAIEEFGNFEHFLPQVHKMHAGDGQTAVATGRFTD